VPRPVPSALAIVALAASAAHADGFGYDPRLRWYAPIGEHVGARVRNDATAGIAVVHELRLSTFRILPDELGAAWATSVDGSLPMTTRLTVGISHSARALGTVDRGGGWCHEGGTHRCSAAYAGGFLDARWLARADRDLALAVLARAGLAGTAPLRPAVRLGVSVRVRRTPTSRLWLVAEPEIQVALGNRADGNRDTLIAPLWLGADLGEHRAAVYLGTGLRGQTVGFGDKWEVPMMLGATFALRPHDVHPIVNLGLEAGFPRLLGPQNTGNVRHAAVWIALTW
jgi:hypothetical protein